MADDSFNPSTPPPAGMRGAGPALPEIDIAEYGAGGQSIDRRVFFQLLVFQSPTGRAASDYVERLADAVSEAGIGGVVYADANDPRGIGLLTWSEDPAAFVDAVRPLFERALLKDLVLRPEYTMLGRTYSTGHEQNLKFWILERPIHNVMEASSPWHVWYPLRRSGAFEKLEPKDKGKILMEHGLYGRAYGAKGLATDIRLACHGLDVNDNEFIIGLIGSDLYPLSHVVQTMRKTRQTSEFIVQMGPFFVGKVVRQISAKA